MILCTQCSNRQPLGTLHLMLYISFGQRCTNPGRQVVMGTEFCTVVPNICGFSVWNLLYVTVNFQVTTAFLKNLRTPASAIHSIGPVITSSCWEFILWHYFNIWLWEWLIFCNVQSKGKGKVKVLLLFSSTSRLGRFNREKETRYPLYRRLGGQQGRSGRVRKILPPLVFDPSRSESLHQLSSPGAFTFTVMV